MKISLSLLISLFFLAACKKETAKPSPTLEVTSTTDVSKLPGPVPFNASFKIKLVKDATHSDEADFIFRQTSSLAYVVNEDAPYFNSGAQASLCSISSDGRDLAINSLPFSKGMSIALNVNAASDGTFSLQKSYASNTPANLHVWLKDALLKDSVDLFKANYNFNITHADANSFGSKRFKLIIRL